MKNITLLIISAYFNGEDRTLAIMPLPDRPACEAAMAAVGDALDRSLTDMALMCRDTGLIAVSPIPKARPDDLMVSK